MLTKFLKRKVIKALKTLIYFILDVDPEESKINILDLESIFFSPQHDFLFLINKSKINNKMNQRH